MNWIKNTKGHPDAVLTMAVIAFAVVITKVLLVGVSFTTTSKFGINFGTIDAATIAACLTPTLGAYVARRHSDQKYPDKQDVK